MVGMFPCLKTDCMKVHAVDCRGSLRHLRVDMVINDTFWNKKRQIDLKNETGKRNMWWRVKEKRGVGGPYLILLSSGTSSFLPACTPLLSTATTSLTESFPLLSDKLHPQERGRRRDGRQEELAEGAFLLCVVAAAVVGSSERKNLKTNTELRDQRLVQSACLAVQDTALSSLNRKEQR